MNTQKSKCDCVCHKEGFASCSDCHRFFHSEEISSPKSIEWEEKIKEEYSYSETDPTSVGFDNDFNRLISRISQLLLSKETEVREEKNEIVRKILRIVEKNKIEGDIYNIKKDIMFFEIAEFLT